MIIKAVVKTLGLALLAFTGACHVAIAHPQEPAHSPTEHQHYHCHQNQNCHSHGHDAGHH